MELERLRGVTDVAATVTECARDVLPLDVVEPQHLADDRRSVTMLDAAQEVARCDRFDHGRNAFPDPATVFQSDLLTVEVVNACEVRTRYRWSRI
jgi:hypothetical protein